jgi:hypothetical protein
VIHSHCEKTGSTWPGVAQVYSDVARTGLCNGCRSFLMLEKHHIMYRGALAGQVFVASHSQWRRRKDDCEYLLIWIIDGNCSRYICE